MASRDRLAESRARRNQDGLPAAEEGRGGFEMTGFTSANQNGDSMSSFYDEITSIQEAIKQYESNVSGIADLQTRSLNVLDQKSSREHQAQLDDLTTETRSLGNNLRERIKTLASWPVKGRDGTKIRKDQTTVLKERFIRALQGYQKVEQQYRERQKERVARQFKIVKQDASPEEIAAVVDDAVAGSNQIFAQAVLSSTRFGEARTAQRNVQERQEDLRKIERTLGELTQLFDDMATLVIQQDETIDVIDTSAAKVEADTREGHRNIVQAVVHAASARKARWICFFIILAVIVALAIGLGVQFGGKH